MTSLIIKIITIPVLFILIQYLLKSVEYDNVWQPIALAIILALVGVAMESLILSKRNFWLSIIADFVVAFILIWVISNVFFDAYVTFTGDLVMSVVVGIVEYFIHRFLISGEHVENAPA